ncbi:MAG: glycosyltransferase family 2 protein [Pseudomonadota bacterium]
MTNAADTMNTSRPYLSLVIPVFNEAEIIATLCSRMVSALAHLTDEYEVIFVNDGSTDSSLQLLGAVAARNKRFRVIDLARNFGHQTAITAGLQYALGAAVIIMDADLQDPPELIPHFVEKWKEGFAIVYAVRAKRKEGLLKRALYKVFYRTLQKLANIDIPLDSGDFGLIDRRVVDIINKMPECNRFIRGLRSWAGFRQTGIPYDRDARFSGVPKYSFSKLFKLALDGLFSFSTIPLRLATAMGFIISGLSFLGIFLYLYRFLTTPRVPGFTTLIIIVLFIGGVQLITVGILGEYIGRIYDETKQRPLFVVRETINIDEVRHAGACGTRH